jgi:hypothetical protein
MSGTGFVVAMQAVIELAPYDEPMHRLGSSTEWLIVSRWGGNGEFLSLSRTGVVRDGIAAPDGLQPRTTFVGILLPALDVPEVSGFLMVRHMPPGITVAGTFAPSDGYARLSFTETALTLAAAGRYAHSRGGYEGRRMLHDIPDPPPQAASAFAWRVTATRRPWSGEFFPDP